MGLIPEDKVAEIRDRTDIVAVIGEHVPLRRAGVNHLGLCPFHAEKTPSFNVNASKQFFYCFGCQKSGDVFKFLMELEGRSFAEVARDLARRAGVEIPENTLVRDDRKRVQQEGERERLLRLNELCAAWFESQLARAERPRAYLAERGLTDKIRGRFRLGYAPEGWDHLVRFLESKRVPVDLLEKSGLGIRRESTQPAPGGPPTLSRTHYDRFRDRVIFPLMNAQGEVIAFGGRILPDGKPRPADGREQPKYINSPETVLYKKGDNLYGLHAARESIRKSRQVILVEGNFDVLAMHEHSLDQAVAPMGTALTETQVRLLKRLLGDEGHVILMLDGDRAGRSATMKDIWLFSQASIADMALFTGSGVDVRVVQLPDGEDPDTFVAKDHAGLERRLKQAKPAVDYVLDEAIKLAEHDNVAGKSKVLLQVAPLLLSIRNETTLALYVDRLADSLAIQPTLVWQHIRRTHMAPHASTPPSVRPPERVTSAPPRAASRPERGPVRALEPTEGALMSLLADHPQLFAQLQEEFLGQISDPVIAEILREAKDIFQSGEPIGGPQLVDLSPQEMRDAVASAVMAGRFSKSENPARAMEEICATLRSRAAQRELNELNQALARAYKAGDQERVQELLLRMQELRLLKAGHAGPRPS